ncbi:MAG: abscisic acid-deficient protein Aba4 family protein [Chloroflexota bacterium]
MDTIFSLSSLLVVPFWLLMILLPNWQWTQRILRSPWVLVAPAFALHHTGVPYSVIAR